MGESLMDRFRASMAALEKKLGSQSAAAAFAGVSRERWRSWREGVNPSAPAADQVITAARRLRRRKA